MTEPKIMPVKRGAAKKARVSEDVTRPPASMDTKEEGTSKGARMKRRTSS